MSDEVCPERVRGRLRFRGARHAHVLGHRLGKHFTRGVCWEIGRVDVVCQRCKQEFTIERGTGRELH
jgi:hypothetical protein